MLNLRIVTPCEAIYNACASDYDDSPTIFLSEPFQLHRYALLDPVFP